MAEIQNKRNELLIAMRQDMWSIPLIEAKSNPNAYIVAHDPLLFADLALAEGAGIPTDDGILTARETARLPLSGTDLVIQSGCGTTGMAKEGDSFVGLIRSFRKASRKFLPISGKLYWLLVLCTCESSEVEPSRLISVTLNSTRKR